MERTPTSPRSSNDVAEFVLGEEVRAAGGQPAEQFGPTPPAVGTITAIRPPGLSTRTISASVAGGFGYQLQHGEGHDGVHCLVTQRQLLGVRAKEADVRPRLGAHRAGQHRLGDVDAECEPVRDLPHAPSAAVMLPGPLPTSRATPPAGMLSHSIGSCQALTNLRASDCALS